MPQDITYTMPDELKPYVRAMLKASGLKEFDAITSVLFAVVTHIDLEQYPILVYLGARGTGKSSAMNQLFPMCLGAKRIHGRTEAAHRNVLREGVRTAFVDEADVVERIVTDLYTSRYSRETATVEVNQPAQRGGWALNTYDIFGATVMAKRQAIADVALRSRAIIIRTSYQVNPYEYTETGSLGGLASGLANRVRNRVLASGAIDRVHQTWHPLNAIAQEWGMTDWYNAAGSIQAQEAETMRGGRGYEPNEAILQAIDIESRTPTGSRQDTSVRISEVVKTVREVFALDLRHNQISEEAEARGFDIGTLHGYPIIKVKKDLLDALRPESE